MINIYKYIYYKLFLFSDWIKRNIPGNQTSSESEALIILTLCISINISSAWLFFNVPTVSGNFNLDFFLLLFIIGCINYFLFIYKASYKKLIEKYQFREDIIGSVLVFLYVLLSIYFFFHYHKLYFKH